MRMEILVGDALVELAAMPDTSIQCCITSPPYLGLRDYGTGTWEGGDTECAHGFVVDAGATSQREGRSYQQGHPSRLCRCGATRVDKQLGLEPTPDEYVAKLVEVFREVKRVLRSDGTLWLNLGASYASGPVLSQRYRLRDDATDADRERVALAMFGVRFDRDETAGEGSMRQVLPAPRQGAPVRGRPGMAGEGVTPVLPAKPGEGAGEDEGAAPGVEVGSDREAGRQVRVLRGDDVGVSDGGSRQRRRGGTSSRTGCEPDGRDAGLPGDSSGGLPGGEISSPVFQLQLRARVLGLLSAHSFSRREIPDSVVGCFEREVAFKQKDLVNIPAMVAEALRADGWYLRSEIIWHKPNPMPESVTDRPTKAHEQVFLLSKSARYYYAADSIRERWADNRMGGSATKSLAYSEESGRNGDSGLGATPPFTGRNKRSVWRVATQPYPEAHFATFPPRLIAPMVAAGCPRDGVVLDPFAGSGTTLQVAVAHGRSAIGIELNPQYAELARRRLAGVTPSMFDLEPAA